MLTACAWPATSAEGIRRDFMPEKGSDPFLPFCRQIPGPSIILARMRWCRHRLKLLLALALPGLSVAPLSAILLTTALLSNTVHALDFEPLGADRGLNAQVITALLVDKEGFLWVGSREGLYRYDGYSAIRFIPEENNPNSITDADIRTVYEDPQGILWIATNSGGLNRYDPVTGQFSAYRNNAALADSLSNDSIYGMAEAGDGRLWVGTQIGLNLLDPASGKVQRFVHDPSNADSLSNNYVYAVHRDNSGSTWISTIGGGVNRWAPQRQGFDRFDFASLLDGNHGWNDVFSISETADGTLWFGTRVGLIRLDPQQGKPERVSLGLDPEVELTITASLVDEAGNIWLTTLSTGVMVLDPATGQTTFTNDRPLGSKGQMPAVPQLALARSDDLLFVGTWGSGVYAGRIGLPAFRVAQANPEQGGLWDSDVLAVLPGAKDGMPWVGSAQGGLQTFDPVNDTALIGTAAVNATRGAGILSLDSAADGRIFAGTLTGFWEFSATTDTARFFAHDDANSKSIGTGYVRRVLADAEGGLWVGVGGSGLFYRPAGSEDFQALVNEPDNPASLSDNYITDLLQTAPGKIWVGTRSHGLNYCTVKPWSCERFESRQNTAVGAGERDEESDGESAEENDRESAEESARESYEESAADKRGQGTQQNSRQTGPPGLEPGLGHFHVTDLYEDSKGRVWIATDGGGVHRAVQDADQKISGFERWTSQNGLISDATVGIVEDDDGTLWVSTREGLSRFDPESGVFRNHVGVAGLSASHFNAGAAARDHKFLYFGAVDGLLTMPLATEFEARKPSRISLSHIEQPSNGSSVTASAHRPESISMPYGEVLSTGFAVLDYAEVPHQYEYQLGESSDWVPLGSKQDVTFFGLAPGYHVLRTRGRDVFGSWNEAAPVRIIVIPPFWMTTWFRALVALVLALLILAAHQARTATLRRRNTELQQLKTQRERALEKAHNSQHKLQEAYEGLRSLTGRLESAKEDERQAISRELHDELGQMLTAAKLNLQMARKDETTPAIALRLDDSVAMIDSMISQVRDISLNLRPPLLDEAGLVPALRHYLGLLEQRSGTKILFDASPELNGAGVNGAGVNGVGVNGADVNAAQTSAIRTVVFRVVQEAVTNALRHASASEIRVTLLPQDQHLCVTIEDNGQGFDPHETQRRIRRGEHLGLLGLVERVHGAGGEIDVNASPGSGSRITVKIPL